MKKRLAAAGLSLALLLSGCGSLWERDYTSVTTHVQQSVGEDNPDVLRAESYQEMVSGVLHFVSQGSSSGTIRLYQYTGDVESDLEMACDEVLKGDPLGSYALRGVEHSYSRIVSYYECTFQFDYRREKEEIGSITTVNSLAALRERIQDAMDGFEPSLAFRVSYRVEDSQVKELARDWYYQNPGHALGYPWIGVEHYPSADDQQQIIEVRFVYPNSREQSLAQAEALLEAAQDMTLELSGDAEGLRVAAAQLLEGLTVEEGGSGSVYDVLVNHEGTSEGVAMAAVLICQQLGLDCQPVGGTLDGEPHWWNVLATEEGETLYFDLCIGELTLQTGEALLEHYWWDGAEELAEALETRPPEEESDAEPETEESDPARKEF